jgi:carbon storage regulator CsrA
MLVLSRKREETIVITVKGERVHVKVVDVRKASGNVRLGITAGPDVTVHRLEVQEERDRIAALEAREDQTLM